MTVKWILPILVVLLIGTAFYLIFINPDVGDRVFLAMGAPPPPPPPPDTPVKPVVVKAPSPEYISPTTTNFVNSAHIADVPQPAQAPQPETTPPASTSNKVFTPPNPLPAQPAWTWQTTDGKTYKDVIIDKVEADRVSIFHDQGSAVIEIYNLPPELQHQLNFDPDLAAQAIAAREKAGKDATTPPAPNP